MNFKKRVNGSWIDTSHYIHNTSTDTLTTLPAVLYPNAATATVGLKGQTVQSSVPSPTSPVMPQGTGERTGNVIDYTQSESGGIDGNGNPVPSSNLWRSTVFIPINSLQYFISWTEVTSFIAARINYYTSEKSHISREQITTTGTALTIPQNAAYFKWTLYATSGTKINLSYVAALHIMLNTGSTALPYEPYGYKIPISSASTTTPIYLGEVQTTRKIKKLVLDGTENWTYRSGVPANVFFMYLPTAKTGEVAISNAYPYYSGTDFVDMNDKEFSIIRSNLAIRNSNYQFESQFKAYLAQQYAAGTPVTVWYVLAEPTTGIVNEPLRKIGDYADEVSGITIPTIAGANTLSVDTTLQPSEVSVNYKGWHPVSAVHEAEQGNNLFDYTTMATSEENSYLMPDGSIGDSNDWNISDYIPCDGTSFAIGYIGGNTPAICLYNENKQYITGKSYNTGGASSKNAVTITSQNTAKYIRFSYCKASGASYDDLSAIMLNKGGSLLTYEPYGTHWD